MKVRPYIFFLLPIMIGCSFELKSISGFMILRNECLLFFAIILASLDDSTSYGGDEIFSANLHGGK